MLALQGRDVDIADPLVPNAEDAGDIAAAVALAQEEPDATGRLGERVDLRLLVLGEGAGSLLGVGHCLTPYQGGIPLGSLHLIDYIYPPYNR